MSLQLALSHRATPAKSVFVVEDKRQCRACSERYRLIICGPRRQARSGGSVTRAGTGAPAFRLCGRVFKCFPRQVLSSLVDSHHGRAVSELVMRSWPLGCWAVMRLSRSMCLLTLVLLVLAATLVGQVIAAPLKNKKQAHRQHTMTLSPLRSQKGGSDYHEQLLDKVPFGSRQWWDIYGRSRPGGG